MGDCGAITYKATDTLTNPDLSMCVDCATKYAAEKARAGAGFIEGTQLAKIQDMTPTVAEPLVKTVRVIPPTIEETVLHRAIVESIQEIVNNNGCQLAIKNLQTHIRMYYGSSDDNSLAADELRLNQLIAEVMNRAKQSDANSEEFLALSQEIAETKKRIAAKKEQ